MTISIIAAVCSNGCIGLDNSLPFHLGGELKYFKSMTEGKAVIYGRETYLSLGRKPLPNRFNIVISRTLPLAEEGICVVRSLEEAVRVAGQYGEEIMIIGGASVYEQSIKFADYLYITEADISVDGDAYFPEYNKNDWKLITEESRSKDLFGGDADYVIKKLKRK